ncbi:MAG: TolC family protein [Magnetococcales bacterium]|nr:TolC family protein [Magnetococcales bacterium]
MMHPFRLAWRGATPPEQVISVRWRCCRRGRPRGMGGSVGVVRSLAVWVSFLGLMGCSVTPDVLSFKDILSVLERDAASSPQEQIPVTAPLSLFEAVARAWKYNLDYRVRLLEKTVAETEVDLASHDQLPRLAANAGFDNRSRLDMPGPQDLNQRSADLNMTWNVLDFGVSYFQAKQASDRLLIADENRRKLAHSQFQEVQTAFWRAVSAQQLHSRIEPVLADARRALVVANQVEQERLRPQLEMMRFQRELLDIVQQLETMREELASARDNLALLINIAPGTRLKLRMPDQDGMQLVPIRATLAEMEQLALRNRPELRVEIYQSRISAADTRKALLRLLPGLELTVSSHYDSNSFATNASWQNAGLQVAGNLLKLATFPTARHLAENQETLNQTRRLALQMAVISQVHVSYRKYLDASRKFADFSKISDVDRRIAENIALDAVENSQNRLDRIRAATRAIMSELQRNKAFADAQNALGMIFVSLGVDLLPKGQQTDDLPALTKAIGEAVAAWNEGIGLPKDFDQLFQDSLDRGSTLPPDQEFGKGLVLPVIRTEAKMTDEPKKDPSTEYKGDQESSALVDMQLQQLKKSLEEPYGGGTRMEVPMVTGAVPPLAPSAASQEEAVKAGSVPTKPADKKVDEGAGEGKNNQAASATSGEEEAKSEPAATPPKTAAPPEVMALVAPDKEVRTLIEEWADAWAHHDAQTFLSFYSAAFVPEDQWDRIHWEDAYTTLITAANQARISLGDVAVEMEKEDQARVMVRLIFTAANETWEKLKTLKVQKEKKWWRIISEKTDHGR